MFLADTDIVRAYPAVSCVLYWSKDTTLPDHGQQHLNALHISKSLYKFCPRVLQAVNTLPKKEVRRDIQRHPIEQIHDINRIAGSTEEIHHGLSLPLEYVQVTNPIPDKHRPNKVTAIRPLLPIRRKDAVSQERAPKVMEALALAIVGKIPGQHGFDMIRLASGKRSHNAPGVALDAVRTGFCSMVDEDRVEEVKEPVLVLRFGGVHDKADCFSQFSILLFQLIRATGNT